MKNILDGADKIAWTNSLLIDARYIVNGLNPIEEGIEYKFIVMWSKMDMNVGLPHFAL